MTTNAYAAKRAIIDRLADIASRPGSPLSGVQVAYSWPGATAELICVYGGGVVFDQPGDGDLWAGPTERLTKEEATVGIHIRVAKSPPPREGIRVTDITAEEIGEEIGRVLMAEPRLAGGKSVTRIRGGTGDYAPIDDQAVSTLSYRISVESYI